MRTSDSIGLQSRAKEAPHQQPGFRVHDIYYVLFRHKWKIIIPALLGLAAGAFIYLYEKPDYMSQAKILVKYVRDTREVSSADGTQLRPPDSRGRAS